MPFQVNSFLQLGSKPRGGKTSVFPKTASGLAGGPMYPPVGADGFGGKKQMKVVL